MDSLGNDESTGALCSVVRLCVVSQGLTVFLQVTFGPQFGNLNRNLSESIMQMEASLTESERI